MNPSADSFDPSEYIHENLPSLEDRMLVQIEDRILVDSRSSTLILSPDGFDDNAVTIVEEVIRSHGIPVEHPLVDRLVTKALALALLIREKRKYSRGQE